MRRRRLFVSVGLLLGLLLLGGLSYIRYTEARAAAARAVARLERLEGLFRQEAIFSPIQLPTLRAELTAAEADFVAVQSSLGPALWLAPRLGWAPGVGPDLVGAAALLDLATSLSRAGRLAVEGIEPLLALAQSGDVRLLGADDFVARSLAALETGEPQFTAARQDVTIARRAREALRAANPTLAGYARRADVVLPLLEKAIALGVAGPAVARSALGFDSAKRYLVLAQNSAELRPTGGFIAGVWVAEVANGKMADLRFYDSGAIDDPTREYPPPPESLFNYMFAGRWLLRDGNWSPHFPTSARVVSNLYKIGHDEAVDGVIALDETAMRAVLGVLGPLHLPEFGETVTADDVLDRVMAQFDYGRSTGRATIQGLPRHKFYMVAVMQAALRRLEDGLSSDLALKLGRAVTQMLAERHLLLYTVEPQAQAMLHEAGWDGGILPTSGDYLQVVDSNVGYSKLNPRILQSLTYTVALRADGAASASLASAYENTSPLKVGECMQPGEHPADYEARMEGCYWDYLRVYAPLGATLTSATYEPLPRGSLLAWAAERDFANNPTIGPAEEGKQVFGNFFVVPAQARKEMAFHYELPSSVGGGGRYSLLVQKQAGTTGLPLRVIVALPAGYRLVSANPAPSRVGGGWVEFVSNLTTERAFEVRYAR